MSVITELTLAVVIVVLFLWLLNHFNRNKHFYKNIPGPPGFPLIGNALEFNSTTKVLNTLQKYTKKYGGIFKVEIGPVRRFIVVTDYKFIECILSSTKLLTKSDDYKFFRPWLGTGLLTSDGHKWKSHRRTLTPAFHFQILEQFIEIFELCGQKLVNKLRSEVRNNSVDVYSYVTLCTLDIICESTMGVKVNAQDNAKSEYVQSVKKMTKIVVERSCSPIQMYDLLYPLTKNYYTQKKVLQVLHHQSNSVIEQKRDQVKPTESVVEEDDTGIKRKKAFLDVLVDASVDGKHLTQEEIREEVDTFMFEPVHVSSSPHSRVKMSVIKELTLVVVIFVLFLWLLNQFNKNKHFYKNIPGPPGLPLIGNALEFNSTTKVLNTLQKYTKKYGGIFKTEIGPVRRFIVVTDYKLIECILSSTKLLTKSDDYKFFRSWLGTGLLTSDGHKWKSHRRTLTPAFHFQILEQFIEIFELCGQKLVNKLRNEVGNNSVDVYSYVTLCTLDIICESTMGVKVNAQDNVKSQYVQSVKQMSKIVVERSCSPIQMYDLLYPLTKNYYTEKKVLKVLHHQSNNVIEQKQAQVKQAKSGVEEDDTGIKRKKAFLDVLVDASIDGKRLTQEEIREEVDTFMFEGHDTTASAISFSLHCLANHPHVQAKAFEEQQVVFGSDPNKTASFGDLQNMKYLEQVIKETLRLYPSVPVYLRETNQEVEFNGMKLPQGDTLLIFAYGIHRNPEYFTNPEEFNPDRFEEMDGRLPFAYIPFSAGPRNCIGQKFAMLEMKSAISKILRNFELKPASPQHVLKLSFDSVLKSVDGVRIKLEPRK